MLTTTIAMLGVEPKRRPGRSRLWRMVGTTLQPLGTAVPTGTRRLPSRLILAPRKVLATTMDQTQAPDDFPEEGIMWERLGTVHITGGQILSIRLSTDGTTSYVAADAVLATVSTTPEIAVFDGSTELIDEVSQVEFIPGTPEATKTFTVTNQGGGDLTLSEPISVPLGFSLTQSFGQLTLQAGQSTTFEVSVNSDTPGGTTGQLQFGSNDTGRIGIRVRPDGQLGRHDRRRRRSRVQRSRLHPVCLWKLL